MSESERAVALVLPEATIPEGIGADDSPAPPPLARSRRRGRGLPYLLILPSLAVLLAILGYPLVRLAVMSTQEFGLREQFGQPPASVGGANFRELLDDPYFWAVLRRSLVFCAVNVVLTLSLGTLVALLLGRLGRRARTVVSAALLLAWAMPVLTTTVVWQWIFDARYGLVNRFLTVLGFEFDDHSWLAEPISFFAVATLIVTWMGIPFVALTLHAGLTQIPGESLEAAAIDGAGPWQRFRDVIFPALRPIYLVLAALSTLWDLKVFTQIYVLQQAGGITRDTNLLGVWAYRESIGASQFGTGAAVALVMVAITLLVSLVYLRRMLRLEEM